MENTGKSVANNAAFTVLDSTMLVTMWMDHVTRDVMTATLAVFALRVRRSIMCEHLCFSKYKVHWS